MRWRRLGIFSSTLCFLMIFGCSDGGQDSSDGDTSLPFAPNFTLPNTELEDVSLTNYQGDVVLLDFWATWCKPCEEEIPLFIELYDQYRSQGFEMIGISMDAERLKVVEPFIKRLGVNYTILLGDPELLNKYDVPVIPSAFLIDRKGIIVEAFHGEKSDIAIYEEALKKIL